MDSYALTFYGIKEASLNEVVNNNNIIKTLLEEVIPSIQSHFPDKLVTMVPSPLSESGYYWSDYVTDCISEEHPDFDWSDFFYFTLYLDENGTAINEDKSIRVSFTGLDIGAKECIYDIFGQHLPGHLVWSGSNTEAMNVHYTPQEDNGRKELRDDDIYPQVNISITLDYKQLGKHGLGLVNYGIEDIPEVRRIQSVLQECSTSYDEEYGDWDLDFHAYNVFHADNIRELGDITHFTIDGKSIKIKKMNAYRYTAPDDAIEEQLI